MIVDMVTVDMCADNESIIALQKPLGKLIAYLVRFFRSDFSGLERLPYLVGNNIVSLRSSCDVFVLTLG